MDILNRIADALQQGDDQQVGQLTAQALAATLPAGDILQRGLVAGMNVVGEQFRRREIFLPEVLLSARAMYAGLDLLKPHLARDGVPLRGCGAWWTRRSPPTPRSSSRGPSARR